jgi:RNA polymerase sigma factor (sigma-70 family)
VTGDGLTDREIAGRIRAGDREALGVLYDRYAATAYALALRIVNARDAAEDVVHDAFVALWRSIGTFDPTRGTLVSWLLTFVRNRAIDLVRARRGEPSTLTTEPWLPPDDPNPTWRATVDRLTAIEIRRALERLPAEQRQAIELAYFDGYTYRDVARLTGVSPGTASSRLRLGLAKLRDMLKADHPTDAACSGDSRPGEDR